MGPVVRGANQTAWIAGASLLGMLALSLTLYVRERPSDAPEPTSMPATADGALPSDHPDITAPLFETRLEELTTRISEDAEDLDAVLQAGLLLQDAHRPLDAVPYFERFLEARPDSAEVWLYLANAFGTDGDWSSAADASRRMLEVHPGHPGGLYNLGAALANQGRYDEARRFWNQAAQSDDESIAARAQTSLNRLPEG